MFSKSKDELIEHYGVIKCGAAQFDALDKSDIITYRKMDYEWQILVSERDKIQKKYPKALIVPATIDEIMLLSVKGKDDERRFTKRPLYCKEQYLCNYRQLDCFRFWIVFLLETSALLILAPVASTTAVFISITSDSGSKWNKNVITMPVSRNQIIREKFIFYILLAVIGLITALIPCIVLMLAEQI